MQSRIAFYDHEDVAPKETSRDISDSAARRMIARNSSRHSFREGRDGTGTRIARRTDDGGQLVKVTMVPNAYAVTG